MTEKDKKIFSKDEYNECDDDLCDLEPQKICDNCGKCIECDKNYKIIKITGIKAE